MLLLTLNDKHFLTFAGDLEVDDENDFWADHDEDCHGEIDTKEMRVEFPDGFKWTCCQKLGYLKGCTKGPHNAVDGKRSKYHGPQTTIEHLRMVTRDDEKLEDSTSVVSSDEEISEEGSSKG